MYALVHRHGKVVPLQQRYYSQGVDRDHNLPGFLWRKNNKWKKHWLHIINRHDEVILHLLELKAIDADKNGATLTGLF
jgi:hypothetical protein